MVRGGNGTGGSGAVGATEGGGLAGMGTGRKRVADGAGAFCGAGGACTGATG